MTKLTLAIALLVSVGTGGSALAQSTANALVLITPEEAKLPPAKVGELTMRAGVSRGPKALLVSPKEEAKAPMRFQVKFESFGGAKVDPASVKVIYLRNPAVDLTDRLKPSIQPTGIDVAAVAMPPGAHAIRIDLKDSDGRSGAANFTVKVAP